MPYFKKKKRSTTPSKAGKPKRALLKDGSEPERVIQARILSWLESSGFLAWRQNSGKIPVHGRMVNLGPDGISDIVVLVPPNGRFLALEVKSANGTLRPVQKAFKARLEAVGGVYKVVRSLQDAMDAVALTVGTEQWKLLPPSVKLAA